MASFSKITKNSLRNSVLDQRDNLSNKERKERSNRITNNLLALDVFNQASAVFIYLHFRGEVQTFGIIDNLITRKVLVCAPKTSIADKSMELIQINNLHSLQQGAYGIPEPQTVNGQSSSIAPEIIDCVILPGAVFDRRGGRIGYGGGFYDRFFKEAQKGIRQKVVKIGLAFNMQVKDEIPQEDHDIPVDYIVTEHEVIRCSKDQAK